MTEERNRRGLFDDSSRYVDRFGVLLLITMATIVLQSLVDLRDGGDLGLVVLSVFVTGTLLLALRASGVAPRYRIVADVIALFGLATSIFLALTDFLPDDLAVSTGGVPPSPVWLLLAITAPVLVVRRLLTHRRATIRTLLGAVSAYLLIAVSFDFAYLAVDAFQSSPFFGVEQPTTSFMYFSLVTLTTLGFGDLAPVTDLGRLLATSEALIGQVYLVTFVGIVVGLLVGQRNEAMQLESVMAPGED